MTFERSSSTGIWTATASTDQGEVVATGHSMREARLALEQLLEGSEPRPVLE